MQWGIAFLDLLIFGSDLANALSYVPLAELFLNGRALNEFPMGRSRWFTMITLAVSRCSFWRT